MIRDRYSVYRFVCAGTPEVIEKMSQKYRLTYSVIRFLKRPLVRLTGDPEQRKINFASLTEKIETSSPAGRLVFHVFAALAEFERNLIRERTVAGLKAARARGRNGGRPAKLTAREIKTIRALLKSSDMPVSEIAARFGIARSTLYRSAVNHAGK